MALKFDHRTTDTKERILKEAHQLYQLGGYSYMGLDQIAKSLNITRAALYHHFPGGKEQLLTEMVEAFTREKIEQWQQAINSGNDARTRFKTMVISILNQPLFDNKRLLCAEMEQLSLKAQQTIQASFEQLHNLVLEVFQEGMERGELRRVELDLAFFSFMGLCQQVENIMLMQTQFSGICNQWQNPEELVAKILDLWLEGIATPPQSGT